MARASLVLLFVLLLAGTAVQALASLATVAARPDVAAPSAPAAQGYPRPVLPFRFGAACPDIVNRSDLLPRLPRRFDDILRGEGPCVIF